jgi:hypothetical protein
MYVKGQDEIFFVRKGKKWNVTYYKGYCGATLLIGTSWVTFFPLVLYVKQLLINYQIRSSNSQLTMSQ